MRQLTFLLCLLLINIKLLMGSASPDSSKVFALRASFIPVSMYCLAAEWRFAPKLLPKYYLSLEGESVFIKSIPGPNWFTPIHVNHLAYFVQNTLGLYRQIGKSPRPRFFDNAYMGFTTTLRMRPGIEPYL